MGVSALWAAFAWGLSEASFFFVVPDVLLTLIALFSAREAFLACGAALAGALLGGGLLHALSARMPERMHRFVAGVPFVRPYMWAHVRSDLETLGWLAIRKGPLRGIPYKLYCVDAPCCLPLGTFLLASIPGRLERFLALTGVFSLAGWLLRGLIQRHPLAAVLVHAALWSAFYARYWATI